MTQTLRLSAAPNTPVTWLWPGRVPLGRLTLLDALPGTGKTTLAANLLAAVTTGRAWPDGTPNGTRRTAVMVAHEDDPSTLRQRLEAAGGDPEAVTLWTRNAAGQLPALPRDLDELTQLLKTTGATLLVLDPLAGLIDTAGGDTKTRERLADLMAAAADLGVAVLALRHPTKQGVSGGGPALYRAGGGSVAIAALARAAYVLAAEPGHPTRLVLAATKASLSPLPGSLSLSVATAPNGGPVTRWHGSSVLTADQILNAASDGGALTEAVSWLRSLLGSGKGVPAATIKRAANSDGLSWRTLERAKAAAGVRSFQRSRQWLWQLEPKKTPKTRRTKS
jgi:hypothetical protein